MAGQGLYPTTNRGHLDSMVSGPTPAPPRREASAAVRAHASFCDIASVPIEPDVRRGPLLVSPRSSRAVGAGVVIVFVARGARLACAFA
jgi:hypothetical protein